MNCIGNLKDCRAGKKNFLLPKYNLFFIVELLRKFVQWIEALNFVFSSIKNHKDFFPNYCRTSHDNKVIVDKDEMFIVNGTELKI